MLRTFRLPLTTVPTPNFNMTSSTTDENRDALFSPSLISPTVISALPDGYSMRPLQRTDFDLGFLDVLRVLTQVGEVSKEEFATRFDQMKGPGGYHILVILDGQQKIVGTGALIVERKLFVSRSMPFDNY